MRKVKAIKCFFLSCAASIFLQTGCSASCQQEENDKKYTQENPIPPRLQWNENFGYCGETSFICAGLYYGQYISQYTARAIASKNTPQNLPSSQLLLGVNDKYAADQMHLASTSWDSESSENTDDFLLWVKGFVLQNQPVIIGVYTNEYLFYGYKAPLAGDPEYDHIVPVIGVGSSHKFSNTAYHKSDILQFSDNGLWDPQREPEYIYNYGFNCFQATRKQANAPRGNIYSLADRANNYGIAITGVVDLNHDTLPVRLTTNVNFEKPEIVDGSNTPPPPMPIILKVTVSNLEPGIKYHLYRYDNVNSVPNEDFNAKAENAVSVLDIQITSGTTFTFSLAIESNETVIYRAVKATAP